VFHRMDRLIFSEIASLTLVILAILSTVMFLFRMLSMTDYLVLTQEGVFSLLMFIIFHVPNILKLTLPLSLLMAAAVVTVRMSGDRETEAWLSSGVSVVRFCRAPFALGLFVALLALGSALWMEPYSRQQWRMFKWVHARKGIEAILQNRLHEKTFIADLFQGGSAKIALFVNRIEKNKADFGGVFMGINSGDGSSVGHSQILTAETGQLRKESESGNYDYIFELRNGRLHQPLPEGGWNVIAFDKFRVSLVNLFQKQFDVGPFDSNDMRSYYPMQYLAELKTLRRRSDWGSNQRTVRDHTFFYEQLVVPLSCIFFPVIGVCLGLQDPRRRVGFAYAGLLFIIFVFYALIMLCQQLAVTFVVPPEVSLCLPLVVLAFMTALALFWKFHHPPSTVFSEFFAHELRKIRGAKVGCAQ